MGRMPGDREDGLLRRIDRQLVQLLERGESFGRTLSAGPKLWCR
jgi:hypothetical protein